MDLLPHQLDEQQALTISRHRGHGTKVGGRKAAARNKELYGADFYRRIGKIGGTKSTGGGFASMTHEEASAAGKKGGSISRRTFVEALVRYNGKVMNQAECARLSGLSRQWVCTLANKKQPNKYGIIKAHQPLT